MHAFRNASPSVAARQLVCHRLRTSCNINEAAFSCAKSQFASGVAVGSHRCEQQTPSLAHGAALLSQCCGCPLQWSVLTASVRCGLHEVYPLGCRDVGGADVRHARRSALTAAGCRLQVAALSRGACLRVWLSLDSRRVGEQTCDGLHRSA